MLKIFLEDRLCISENPKIYLTKLNEITMDFLNRTNYIKAFNTSITKNNMKLCNSPKFYCSSRSCSWSIFFYHTNLNIELNGFRWKLSTEHDTNSKFYSLNHIITFNAVYIGELSFAGTQNCFRQMNFPSHYFTSKFVSWILRLKKASINYLIINF